MEDKLLFLHDFFFGVFIPMIPLGVGLLGYYKVSSGHKKWVKIIIFIENILFAVSVVLSGINSSGLSFAATVGIFTSIAGALTVLSTSSESKEPSFNAGFVAVTNMVIALLGYLIAFLKWLLINN